jgi:hypothetical protein
MVTVMISNLCENLYIHTYTHAQVPHEIPEAHLAVRIGQRNSVLTVDEEELDLTVVDEVKSLRILT